MRWFLSRGSNKGEHRKDPDPITDDIKGKDGGFLTLDGCLMIFGGLMAYDSKRHQKVTRLWSIRPNRPHLPFSGGQSLP